MGVSIWEGTNASPELVKGMQEKMPSNTAELYDFANDFIARINGRISEMVSEGKEVCYVSYSMHDFSVNKGEKGKVTIWYNGYLTDFTAEVMAIAQLELERKIAEHEYYKRLYKEYDETAEKFKGLRKTIEDHGGSMTLRRPFIEVSLPTDRHSLDTCNHSFPGNEFFYGNLRSKLDGLLL